MSPSEQRLLADLRARVAYLERNAEVPAGSSWTTLPGVPSALKTDPNADRIIFWDDSASALAHLGLGAPLSIAGTTLNVAAATTAAAGVLPIATSAQAVAGTDGSSAVVPTGVAAALAAYLPSGLILPTALAAAPSGWLLCDGSAVSRSTYAALFAAIGTTYGAGNGSTTFNVPNLKGRVVVGIDAAQTEFDVRGETGGAKTHTLAESEIPSHTHAGQSGSAFVATGGTTAWVGGTSGFRNFSTTAATGGGGAHNNLQPYMALHYLIRT